MHTRALFSRQQSCQRLSTGWGAVLHLPRAMPDACTGLTWADESPSSSPHMLSKLP